MRRNTIRQKWDAGKPVLNGWLNLGSAFGAEIVAHQGLDSLTLDLQHGFQDYSHATGILQVLSGLPPEPMARVPWNEPGIIMKLLDAGAFGIICPMVNTVEQASAFAAAMRYPPRGNRSYGPTRTIFSAGSDYFSGANDEVVAFAMIETAEALRNVDAIAAVDGIDALYIGPSDLSIGISNGRLKPGMDREEPEVLDAIHRVIAAAKSAGKRVGLHCGGTSYAAKAIGWGVDLVTIATDSVTLARGTKAQVDEMKRALA